MNQLKLSFTTLLLFFVCSLWAQQDSVTTYFDAQWNEVKSKNETVYYRKSYRQKGNVFAADYYKSGIVMLTGNYSDKKCNIRNGCFINYSEEGIKISENYYKKGKRTGQWRYWNREGILTESMYYNNDVLDGTFLTFNANGKVASEAVYANGIRKTFKTNPYPAEPEKANTPAQKFDEHMAEYEGGEDSLMAFLSSNIVYPNDAKKKNIQGRVILQFIIDVQGEVKDVTIVKSVETSLDQEALRVVKLMPPWKPGKIDGKNVPIRYTLPIVFKLN